MCVTCLWHAYQHQKQMIDDLLNENAMLTAPLSPSIQNHRIERLVAQIDMQYASLGEDIQTLASVCRRLANPPEEGDKGGGDIPSLGVSPGAQSAPEGVGTVSALDVTVPTDTKIDIGN